MQPAPKEKTIELPSSAALATRWLQSPWSFAKRQSPSADAGGGDDEEVMAHEMADVDQELRRHGQLGAEVREHGREHRDDEDQEHVHEHDGEGDDAYRVGHGRLHLLRQLD